MPTYRKKSEEVEAESLENGQVQIRYKDGYTERLWKSDFDRDYEQVRGAPTPVKKPTQTAVDKAMNDPKAKSSWDKYVESITTPHSARLSPTIPQMRGIIIADSTIEFTVPVQIVPGYMYRIHTGFYANILVTAQPDGTLKSSCDVVYAVNSAGYLERID